PRSGAVRPIEDEDEATNFGYQAQEDGTTTLFDEDGDEDPFAIELDTISTSGERLYLHNVLYLGFKIRERWHRDAAELDYSLVKETSSSRRKGMGTTATRSSLSNPGDGTSSETSDQEQELLGLDESTSPSSSDTSKRYYYQVSDFDVEEDTESQELLGGRNVEQERAAWLKTARRLQADADLAQKEAGSLLKLFAAQAGASSRGG
ncbi:unnamed protein product, partial [Amoebophrya sp. A120]